jgi:hypothetical protein
LVALVGQARGKVNDFSTEKLSLAKVSEAGKIKNHSQYDFLVKKYMTNKLVADGVPEKMLLAAYSQATQRRFLVF